MRLKPEIIKFLKLQISNTILDAKIYLFGSRVVESKKGGDIDILLITENKVPLHNITEIKIAFYKKFGWQKIDIINFTINEKSIFKEIALKHAIEL